MPWRAKIATARACRLVALLNDVTAGALYVSSAACFWLYGEMVLGTPLESKTLRWSIVCVGFIAVTGLAFELAWIASGYFTGLLRNNFKGVEQMHGDAQLMVLLYLFISAFYLAMGLLECGQVVHVHRISGRPIYSLRYLEWTFTTPTLVWISGRAASKGGQEAGFAASSRCSSGYIVAAWVASLVSEPWVNFGLVCLAFVGFVATALEQLLLACCVYGRSQTGRIQAKLIVYTVVFYAVYGAVYCLADANAVSPEAEQLFYTWGDVTVKLGHSITLIMIRRTEDSVIIRMLETKAVSLANDLTRLIKTASVPIFGVDREGRVTEWNKKMADITRLSKEEAIGTLFRGKVTDGTEKDVENVLKQAFSGQSTKLFELHLKRFDPLPLATFPGDLDDQAKLTLMVSVTPKVDADGTVKEAVLIGQDLTEIAAVKEEAELRKSRFLAAVSHELRSPLHGIIGLTEALAASDTNPGRAKQLIMVKNCATRLLDLVVSIMDFTLLTQHSVSGKRMYKLSRDFVELPKIIEEVIELVKTGTDKQGRTLLKPGVNLVNDMDRGLPIMQADAHKIYQVFYNILANACKFTKRGQIVVSSAFEPFGKAVEVTVADTGKGISQEALKTIFEPFEREENPDLTAHEGIGLGLSISQEVVAQHGGRIEITSEVAVGTTCKVHLPVIMAAQPDDTCSEGLPTMEDLMAPVTAENLANAEANLAFKASLQALVPPTTDGRKPLVLSIDEDYVNQAAIQALLSETYDVQCAMSGQECMDFLRSARRSPDVLLLDLLMSGMSGADLCRTVREDLLQPSGALPIVLLSTRAPLRGSNEFAMNKTDSEGGLRRAKSALSWDTGHAQQEALQALSAKQWHARTSGMPPQIAERFLKGEGLISDSHACVTILFCEIVGLESLEMTSFITLLNQAFSAFDRLTEEYGVYKVEGFGDTYMCASGHDGAKDHATRMVLYGLALIDAASRISLPQDGSQVHVRVGVHSGPALTGVVGWKSPRYCFFGDTINISCRMETYGVPGFIHISQRTRDVLNEKAILQTGAQISEQGTVDIKGQGAMATHLIIPPGMGEPARRSYKKKRTLCLFSAQPSSNAEAAEEPAPQRSALEAIPMAVKLELDGLRAQLASARDAASMARAELQAARKAQAKLSEELVAAEKAAREKSAEAVRSAGTCTELRCKMSEALEKGRDLEEQLRSTQAELAASLQQKAEAEEKAGRLEQECLELRASTAQLSADRERQAALQRRVEHLEAEKMVLEASREELRRKLEGQPPPQSQGWRGGPAGGFSARLAAAGTGRTSVAAHCGAARRLSDDWRQPLLDSSSVASAEEELRGLCVLLEGKEQDMECLRRELTFKDQQLRSLRAKLDAALEDGEAKDMQLQHALLDLRLAAGLPPTASYGATPGGSPGLGAASLGVGLRPGLGGALWA